MKSNHKNHDKNQKFIDMKKYLSKYVCKFIGLKIAMVKKRPNSFSTL